MRCSTTCVVGMCLLYVPYVLCSPTIKRPQLYDGNYVADDDVMEEIQLGAPVQPNGVKTFSKKTVASEDEALQRKVALVLLRRILEQGDILSPEKQQQLDRMVADDQLECDVCEVGVKLIQVVLNSNIGESIISDVAVAVCKVLNLEDNRVCLLAVKEFRDEFFYIIFNLKPNELCYWLLKLKCTKPAGFLEEWDLHIPGNQPPYQPPKLPVPGKPTTKFLFFTDMHMDVRYKEGASAVCGEPLCCRDNNPTPTNPSDGAGKYGDYRNCDMPPWTVDGMMESLKGVELDFIIYTGDIPAHNVWNQSSDDQIDKINRWTNVLKKYFPQTPVYSSVGNHESAPVNSYPPHSIYDQPGANITWLYEALHKSWSNWIPEEDLATVMQGGFYTTLIRPGLRVVSLNTNYCSDDSWWLLVGSNAVDPEGQLSWLINVLQKAEATGEKVFIISHRPTSGCMDSWSLNYYNIVNRFQNNIIAQLFGHAHTDELKVYYDVETPSRVSVVGLIGPAFTTYSYKNSGYRVYTMDGDYDETTNALLDAESYYLNITDANINDDPKWQLEYTFSKDYGMKNLSPSEWQNLVDRFTDDDDLFQLYHKHISKSEDTSFCDANCKESTIGDIKYFRSGDNNSY